MQSSRINNRKSLHASFVQGTLISQSKIQDGQICNLMDVRKIHAKQEIDQLENSEQNLEKPSIIYAEITSSIDGNKEIQERL